MTEGPWNILWYILGIGIIYIIAMVVFKAIFLIEDLLDIFISKIKRAIGKWNT